MGFVLVILGILLCAVGSIWILVAAFKESILWGLGVLFINSIVTIIFVIMHFEETKKPFIIWIIGVVLMIVGVVISPGEMEVEPVVYAYRCLLAA